MGRKNYLCLAIAVACFFAGRAWAVNTPYNNTPVALVANDGEYWDDQLAAVLATAQALNNKGGQMVVVADFCHSGGLIDNLQSANTYLATAAAWNELSLSFADLTVGPVVGGSDGAFGQTFMNSSMTKTLANSYNDAVPQVPNQTPQQSAGANAPTSLAYNTGDRAIIFSAGDSGGAQEGSFFTDVSVAYNALVGRGANPWPANRITTLWDQGQTNGTYGTGYITAASTKQNLTNAIATVFADPAFTSSNKLFMYFNDHGTSTDTLPSKVTGPAGTRVYSYQVTVGTGNNPATGTKSPGVWWVALQTGDNNAADYSNWVDIPGWTHSVVPGFVYFNSPDPTDPTTWLIPGQAYNFGFTNIMDPVAKGWSTFLNTQSDPNNPNNYDISDIGLADGSALGSGGFVYNLDAGANDPSVWPTWQTGGDGYVLVPTPEPASLALLAVGAVGLLACRRRAAG